jgi:hypothetical protein
MAQQGPPGRKDPLAPQGHKGPPGRKDPQARKALTHHDILGQSIMPRIHRAIIMATGGLSTTLTTAPFGEAFGMTMQVLQQG